VPQTFDDSIFAYRADVNESRRLDTQIINSATELIGPTYVAKTEDKQQKCSLIEQRICEFTESQNILCGLFQLKIPATINMSCQVVKSN